MKFVSTVVLLALCFSGFAQGTRYRHAVNVEVSRLGYQMPSGVFIQYDYMFKHSLRGFWDARVAAGGFGFNDTWNAYSLRSNLTYNKGRQRHYFEFGVAAAFVDEYYAYRPEGKPQRDHYYFGPQAGYKLHGKKGLQVRTYLGMYIGMGTTIVGGVGLGWAFGKRE